MGLEGCLPRLLGSERLRLKGNRYTFDDLDAKALQRWNMPGHVGEQTYLTNTQIGEYLSSQTDVPEDTLVGSPEVLGAGAIGAVDAEVRWLGGAVDRETALGVMEINEGSATSFGNLPERGIHGCAAVAVG